MNKQCKCGCGLSVSYYKEYRKYHDELHRVITKDETRHCSNCGLEQDIRLFIINPLPYDKSRLSFGHKCLKCKLIISREYSKTHPQKLLTKEQYQRARELHVGDIWEKIGDTIARCKRKCLKNNLPFNITTDYLLNLYNQQNGKCYYTNENMVVTIGTRTLLLNTASLEKLNPIKGYTIGNVVWCTYLVNTMKQNMNELEFYKYLKTILINKDKLKNDLQKM